MRLEKAQVIGAVVRTHGRTEALLAVGVMDRISPPERMPVVGKASATTPIDVLVLVARQPPPTRDSVIPLGVDERSQVGESTAWGGNEEP